MRRMFDMIRSSSVSATVMQAAARGALAVPGTEMIEILVYLANHNKVFGQQARMTLAGWELKSSLEAASNPATPKEVLDYYIAPENLRPPLLPALLENPGVKQEDLTRMALEGSREVVEAMRKSARVQGTPDLVRALASNPNSLVNDVAPAKVEEPVLSAPPQPTAEETVQLLEEHAHEKSETTGDLSLESSPEENAAFDAFLTEHARELSIEGEKPFQPLGGIHEFEVAETADAAAPMEPEAKPAPAAVTATAPARPGTATAARVSAGKKPH